MLLNDKIFLTAGNAIAFPWIVWGTVPVAGIAMHIAPVMCLARLPAPASRLPA